MAIPTAFCATEDVALKARADFAEIAPRDCVVAGGTDGAILANGFTLSSATDFAVRGAATGDVVLLEKGAPIVGDKLAVDSVAGTSLALRRLCRASGYGQPPGGATDLAGIHFRVISMASEIAEATRILRVRFRVFDEGQLQDPTDFRRACVLRVLVDLYGNAHRGAGNSGGGTDNLRDKFEQYNAELQYEEDILGRTYGIERPSKTIAPVVGPSTVPTREEDRFWNPPDIW